MAIKSYLTNSETFVNKKAAPLTILGIETSCDETAVAIVRTDKTIVANVVHSQLEEHTPYGGVVPEIAARAHMDYLDNILHQALSDAAMTLDDVDAFAVTSGPGLIGGVIVGVMAAKAYASVLRKPIYGINHLEGHALTARLTGEVSFPYLLLLVSGGHCQILIVEGVGRYSLLGGTLDDALGEAFDKTAKMMGLGYPGGPQIEKIARNGDPLRFTFPRPLTDRAGCDFSFSGLKTSVRLCLQELSSTQNGHLSEQDKADIAASFQHTAALVLENRLRNAMLTFTTRYPSGKQLVVAGGVAANTYLRQRLESVCSSFNLELSCPPIALCTDNAAMIAWAACERINAGIPPQDVIEPMARWGLCSKEAQP
jgi:N6-L-threonylcarbamoyladenine synthase